MMADQALDAWALSHLNVPYQSLTVDGDKVPVDLIIWRKYRAQTPGLVEQVYNLNKGLADLGVNLPHGADVTIPLYRNPSYAQVTPLKLW